MKWFKVISSEGDVVLLLHLPAGEETLQPLEDGQQIVEIDEAEAAALRQEALLRSLLGDA